jgi:hypothetical protein
MSMTKFLSSIPTQTKDTSSPNKIPLPPPPPVIPISKPSPPIQKLDMTPTEQVATKFPRLNLYEYKFDYFFTKEKEERKR